jgi:hypothetical protein
MHKQRWARQRADTLDKRHLPPKKQKKGQSDSEVWTSKGYRRGERRTNEQQEDHADCTENKITVESTASK